MLHGLISMKKRQNEKVCPEVQQWFGTTFTNNKAGMADVDKDKVKRVVYEMSKVRHLSLNQAIRLQCQQKGCCVSDNFHIGVIFPALPIHMQDSPHFKHGLRLQAQTEDRIKKMKQQAQALTPAELLSHTR